MNEDFAFFLGGKYSSSLTSLDNILWSKTKFWRELFISSIQANRSSRFKNLFKRLDEQCDSSCDSKR